MNKLYFIRSDQGLNYLYKVFPTNNMIPPTTV